MIRNYGLVICEFLMFSILGLHFAHSQDPAMVATPAFNGGVFVTPVPGVPFSGFAEQEMIQTLRDGTSFQRKTAAFIARDFQGRIHNESREVLPVSSTGEPALLSIHIYDPNTHLNTFLNPSAHIARQSTLSNPPQTAPPSSWAQRESGENPSNPNAQYEDLGTNTLDGIVVHGYRRTMTLSSEASGTGEPVAITDEYWYSEELHLNLVASHGDPRTGKLTAKVTRINRNEPSADLFQIPSGYKLVDVTPPE